MARLHIGFLNIKSDLKQLGQALSLGIAVSIILSFGPTYLLCIFSKDGNEEEIGDGKVMQHWPTLGDSSFASAQTQGHHLWGFFSVSDAKLLLLFCL